VRQDLEPVFAEFGKVHCLVVEPSRREVVVVRMPHDAAQKAKAHFAEHPLRVKDKELQVSDAPLECFLFVGNLNEDVEPEHLRSLFQAHGEPERTIVRLASTLSLCVCVCCVCVCVCHLT
jgi:hypothetical protein